MIDLCHLDEAGFALTLPTSASWSPVGQRQTVRYVAPEGRQVNVLGAYFSHGQQVGEFQYECLAKLPQRGTKRKSLAERAEPHGLTAADVGAIDSGRFLAFVWRRLDEILHQRAAVVDNAAGDAIEVKAASHD